METPQKRQQQHQQQHQHEQIDGMDASTPLRRYFSRKSNYTVQFNDLPVEPGYIGHYSAWGCAYGLIFLTVPVAYVYISFILLRELCMAFPHSLYEGIVQQYLPVLAWIVSKMEKSSLIVEAWCVIEGVFYIMMKLHIKWLQMKDPLEASLSAAPMMDLKDRALLWTRMMGTAKETNYVDFITGWFFDSDLNTISRYDVRDFLCWSMFEGRNQEHLTEGELRQLEGFLEDLEVRLSYHLYGETTEEVVVEEEQHDKENAPNEMVAKKLFDEDKSQKKRPWKVFRFEEVTSDDQPNFFSTLYENYKQRYEQARNIIENVHPVQDLRNMMADAEEKTLATASHMYENASSTATHMAANAYDTIIGSGSKVDKQLSAIGHATQQQLSDFSHATQQQIAEFSQATQQQLSEFSHATQQQVAEAWISVKGMKERLEMAEFLSTNTKRLRQQLKGYRVLLKSMREMSSAVPSKQMANLMRRITECNEAMEGLESRAMDGFFSATGFAQKKILGRKEPQRYARYNSDPLLGVSTYPLGLHLVVLGATEIPLRVMLKNRGFTRSTTGPVSYYFHPGAPCDEDEEKTPIVFVHGIGIGLIVYLPLIEQLLKTGRPIFLPEIPYVSGFRPWQSPNAVLQPAVVCSTMTEMMAKHGYLKGAFAGHSYGTTWLAYMCKFAPHAIVAVCFLDPVCFCLHMPRLTKQFVYHRPDPGTVSYMVRTDVNVSWTIQRAFPWSWIVLFAEQIHVPCSVFLSDRDMLVPAEHVEKYLSLRGAAVKDYGDANKDHFGNGDLNVTIFRGDVHGGWTERPEAPPVITDCLEVLCEKAETRNKAPSARLLQERMLDASQ